MKTTPRIATIGAAASLTAAAAAAAFAGPAAAAPVHQPEHGSVRQVIHRLPLRGEGAVFVQTDNLAGNTVVAYDRAPDGTLTQAGVYPTGGLGGQLSGSVVDHTASQGSLAYDQANHLLYAVNAGSNTITSFAVRGDRLTRLQTIGSGGEFPVSITVHGGQLYVLNARGGGSIQGYLRLGGLLVKVPSWHRDLGFNPNPTPEFTSTPGQIAFTPDGSKLIVTTKGDGQSIEVFGVGLLGPSIKPVVTSDPGNVPFAIEFDQQAHVLIAEAGPSAVATFTINRNGTLTLLARTATGQAATCWVTSTGDRLYASNAGSASVSGYHNDNGTLTPLGNTSTDPGTVDAAASPNGRFLYVQTGGNGVVDEFKIGGNGSLTEIGSITVPGGAGGEGIVAS
ncbi:lactonase family protein [Jatrophihabitans sp. DSM 45814]